MARFCSPLFQMSPHHVFHGLVTLKLIARKQPLNNDLHLRSTSNDIHIFVVAYQTWNASTNHISLRDAASTISCNAYNLPSCTTISVIKSRRAPTTLLENIVNSPCTIPFFGFVFCLIESPELVYTRLTDQVDHTK